jgi:type IV secretion system protein TrbF
LALRGKHIVVVPVDLQGRSLGSIVAGQTTVATDNMRRATLADWVSDLRMVTVDGVAQREAINRVYAKIASGSPAHVFISDFYRNGPPQSRALKHTVHIEVNSVLPTSDRTYQVEWLETTRDLPGQIQSQQRWKGAFTIAINPPEDEGVARINALGLYVTHASWSKVLMN